ncbi:MAG: alpha-L-fucosidase [Opitutaceae bacterium]
MTLNRHWGYNKHDNDWKSAETIIQNLCDIASKGGNYLLNAGPTAEGLIPPESVDILKQVGAWMKVNGEAIYDTQAGPSRDTIRLQPDGRMTTKPGKLYLHVFNWPKDGRLFLEGMRGDIVKKAYLLANPKRAPLALEPHERSLFIEVPAEAPDAIASVVAVEFPLPAKTHNCRRQHQRYGQASHLHVAHALEGRRFATGWPRGHPYRLPVFAAPRSAARLCPRFPDPGKHDRGAHCRARLHCAAATFVFPI